MLLDGRRKLVQPDGKTSSSSDEQRLDDIIEIPVPQGKNFVGRKGTQLFRYTEPLGDGTALGTAEDMRVNYFSDASPIGSAPQAVVIWFDGADRPAFLDVDRQRAITPSWVVIPPKALVFADMSRGVGIFPTGGIHVTSNGGATWDPLLDAGSNYCADSASFLRYEDGKVIASGRCNVEIDTSSRSAREVRDESSDDVTLVEWVRQTGTSPLRAAVRGGVLLGDTGSEAVVAQRGLVARVDLATSEAKAFAKAGQGSLYDSSACEGTRVSTTPDTVVFLCPLGDDEESHLRPVEVTVTGDKLTTKTLPTKLDSDAVVFTSASGGVMALGECKASQRGYDEYRGYGRGQSTASACVRQPGGEFKKVEPSESQDLATLRPGPTKDGRVVGIRGTVDEESDFDSKGTRFVVVSQKGDEVALPAIRWAKGTELPTALTNVEEVEPNVVHALFRAEVDGTTKVFSVRQSLVGKEAAKITKLETQREVSEQPVWWFHGRGFVFEEGEEGAKSMYGPWMPPATLAVALGTTDGGKTWKNVTLPVGYPYEAVTNAWMGNWHGEAGVEFQPFARVGWGADSGARLEFGESEGGGSRTPIKAPSLAPIGTPHQLVCKTSGTTTAVPVVTGDAPVYGGYYGYGGYRAPSDGALDALKNPRPLAPGARAPDVLTFNNQGRFRGLDTQAVFERDWSTATATAPAKVKSWTFRWVDMAEQGAKPRSVSVTPPADAPPYLEFRLAASQGSRALFYVGGYGTSYLVRTNGLKTELFPVPPSLKLRLPSHAVFGEGDSIAWLSGPQLVLWRAGEAPRVLAYVPDVASESNRASTPTRWIGAPTKDVVPLFAGGSDWGVVRTIKITTLDPKTKEPTSPPEKVGLTSGWIPAGFTLSQLPQLSQCAAAPAAGGGPVSSGGRATKFECLGGIPDPARGKCVCEVGKTEVTSGDTSRCVVGGGQPAAPAVAATLKSSPYRILLGHQAGWRGQTGSIDGLTDHYALYSVYDVRSDGKGGACVGGVTSTYSLYGASPPPAKKGAPGPVGFVRFDAVSKKAEGGLRGLANKDNVRKLACSWDAK